MAETRDPTAPTFYEQVVADTTRQAKAAFSNRIASLEAQVARLSAVVDTLPRTEDGVPVTPRMTVYVARDGEIDTFLVGPYEDGYVITRHGATIPASRCYSTHQAASQPFPTE
jgi:hypothetical protein